MRGRPTQSIAPVVVVWKASKHGRSKPKMKVFKTKHVDDIIADLKQALDASGKPSLKAVS